MTMVQRWTVAVVTVLLIALPALLWRIDGGARSAVCASPTLALLPLHRPGQRAVPQPTVVACDGSGQPLRGGSAVLFGQPVDVNRASALELAEVPGISRALGRAIVDERTLRGPFAQLTDLRRVPGIGARRLARLTPLVTTGAAPPLAR